MDTAPTQSRKPRLLAIDDSEMIHRLLKARLKSERLEIHNALTGTQGLSTARALMPDVILLDVDMPDMNGFEVLRELKADAATHDIPVIFLSGSCDMEEKIRGLDMGAHDFVTKPFVIGELRARVRSALRIRLLITMLAQRAQVDGLTGLWNRTYLDQRLATEIDQAQRHGTPLALVLADVDHFKAINDRYGHPFGDHVLEEFAHTLSSGRSSDVACRYGGEEFAIVLPTTTRTEAVGVAERLRTQFSNICWIDAPGLKVTASFGVTDLEIISTPSPKAMLQMADDALYAAKQGGRNRVAVAQGEADGSVAMKLSA